MQLHYFKDPAGNFGDDLNAWLWPRLVPGLLDDDPAELLVGIGTLINHRLPPTPVKHVLGSGVGYGGLPPLNGRLWVHALRGFISARWLNVPERIVITDPAVLVRVVELSPVPAQRERVGLMLTGASLDDFDWEPLCREAGVAFISCRWSVDRVLGEIRRCDLLLTEAMHGAIVADALRVPWVPVNCNIDLLDLKWRDWLSSLRMTYEPVKVTALFDRVQRLSATGRVKHLVKRGVHDAGVWRVRWGDAPRQDSTSKHVVSALRDIRNAAKRHGLLSNQQLLNSHVERYLELLGRLRAGLYPRVSV